MMRWIKQLGEAARELIAAEATQAMYRFRQLGLVMGALIALFILAAIAMAALLAGFVLLLVPQLGLPGSLLIVSSVVLLTMCAAIWWTYRYAGSQPTPDQARRDADAAKAQLSNLVSPGDGAAGTTKAEAGGRRAPSPAGSPVEKIVSAVAEHPLELAGAAFAAAALIGARRSVRMVRTALATVSAGLVAYRTLSSLNAAVKARSPNSAAKYHGDGVLRSPARETTWPESPLPVPAARDLD